MSTEKVSIILPVYNAEKYLYQAIKSILTQTYTNFELIIIDDGSTDESLKIIQSFDDERIQIIQNEQNLGLIKTLNKGIDLAKGEYIARMDADDIAMPKRLEKQVAFLEKNIDYGLIGTMAEMINEKGISIGKIHDLPISQEAIKSRILFQCPFIHPTVMGKTSIFKEFKYHENFPIAEDFFLWVKVIEKYKVANLDEVFLQYRVHSTNVSSDDKNFLKKEQSLLQVFTYQFHSLNIQTKPDNIVTHLNLCSIIYAHKKSGLTDYRLVYQWIEYLIAENKKSSLFQPKLFKQNITLIWYRFCLRNAKHTLLNGFSFYLKTPLGKQDNLKNKIILLVHTIGNYPLIKPIYLFMKKYFVRLIKLKI
jgi:glycosyltransferase involved in cell wall biosynthesis